MKKSSMIRGLLAAVLAGCLGCRAAAPETAPETAPEPEEQETDDSRIREMISRMTPEQKLTQMMIVGLRSDASNSRTAAELDDNYRVFLQKYDFGGIILFGGNIQDIEQTVKLIRDCQTAAMQSENGVPMFICTDQEGGAVSRVGFGTIGPGNMALAAAGDTALTEECADILGQEIASLGFNMDFAPVSDVNSNPNNPVIGVRSFSDDPQLVSEHIKAFIRGLRKNDISAALKHFPGHGNVSEDSHTGLPCSDMTLAELKECDLVPFAAGIEENAEMIMTAHIQYPSIETGTYTSVQDGKEISLPATLSAAVIRDLLREDMGYEGIVITDAMGMDAIAKHFDPVDAGVLAINADVDILLEPVDLYKDDEIDTFPVFEAYLQGMAERIGSGEISEEELDNSVYRILKLKMESGILDNTPAASEEEMIAAAQQTVGTAEHHHREWELTQQGLTLLKNEGNVLPADGNNEKTLILYPSEYRRPAADYALQRLAKENLLDPALVSLLCYNGITADDPQLQNELQYADKVLILSQAAFRNEEIAEIIDQLHEESRQCALISLNLPYDAACYEEADAVLCAFNSFGSAYDAEGNGPFNLNVASVLCAAFGESVPQGILPVNVPKVTQSAEGTVFSDEWLYERGYGLQNWGR